MKGLAVAVCALLAACAAPVAPAPLALPPDPLPSRLWPSPARAHPAVASRSRPPVRHHFGLDWWALARCESHNNPRDISHTGKFRGAFQFSLSTWHSVGMAGDPIDASYAVQLGAAQKLYRRDGRSPWPYCGRFL